jgi:AraC-like DNA-binding protein
MRPDSLPTYDDRGKRLLPDTHEPVLRGIAAKQVFLAALGRGHYPGQRLPARTLPGLCSVGFWDAARQQQWGTGMHYNEGLEIHAIEAGQLTFSAMGQRHILQAGDATVTRPWLEHSLGDPCVGAARACWLVLDVGIRAPDDAWRWPSWIVLSPADRRELARLLTAMEVHVWRASDLLRRCFQRIAGLIASGRGLEGTSLLGVLINEALVLLLEALREPREDSNQTTSTQQQVERFWKRLRADPAQLGREWSLQGLAASCGLGETRLVHYTRQLTNLPPLHYLRLCRLELAAQWLLRHPEKTITAVALSCGFSSPQYFSHLFQQHFGCTPNIYRLAGRATIPSGTITK